MNDKAKVHFAVLQDEDGYPPYSTESVWATRSEGGLYRIDNIPFFAREATMGDCVSVDERNGELWFVDVVKASGDSLLRVVIFDESRTKDVRKELSDLRCRQEFFATHQLIAVSVPETVDLEDVMTLLRSYSDDEVLDYEAPLLRHRESGSNE